MGLALVEFVMAVEDAFDVRITDEVAETIRTPRDLIDWLAAEFAPGQGRHCPTQHTFYSLRSAIRKVVVAPRRAIRPATRWDALLPGKGRARAWRRIREQGGGCLPALRLSPAKKWALALLAAAGTIALVAALAAHPPRRLGSLAAAAGCLGLLYLAIHAMAWRWSSLIPAGCATLGDSVRFGLAPIPITPRAATRSGPWCTGSSSRSST